MEGYNIKFKMGNKTLIAVTQDDMAIAALTKDSITKDDNGAKKTTVTGHDVTFNVAGLVEFDSASGTTKNDCDALLEQALKKGSQAVIEFTYVRGTGKSVTGSCVMTNYAETAPADPDNDTTYTASFKATGDVATA